MRDRAHRGEVPPSFVEDCINSINPNEQPPKPGQAEDWLDDVQWTIVDPNAPAWPTLDCPGEMRDLLFEGINIVNASLTRFKRAIWELNSEKACGNLKQAMNTLNVMGETMAVMLTISAAKAKKGANREGK